MRCTKLVDKHSRGHVVRIAWVMLVLGITATRLPVKAPWLSVVRDQRGGNWTPEP